MPVRSLITGAGGLWVGTGRAFRDAPLASTLIVLQAYGQTQPWVLLTDTPVAQTEPTLYACRNWIEQGLPGPQNGRLEVAQDAPPGSHRAWAATGWCWRLPPCWPWPTARAARTRRPAIWHPAACVGPPPR